MKEENVINQVIMVGDKILIKPKTHQDKTSSGLYLPPGVIEKENVQSGYVIKAGPGFPIPFVKEEDEPWKQTNDEIKYIPLQIKEGDLALYLQKNALEVELGNEKYMIISQSSILMVIRDQELFG
jgi:chaperonin GroES